MKYVYIYDVTPDYVHGLALTGYLNSYIYGPTIVYGTGFYYRPWYRTIITHVHTWGFGVTYNPWVGWGMSYGFSTGWFNTSFGLVLPIMAGRWLVGTKNVPSSALLVSPYRFNGGYYGCNAYVYNRNTYIQYNNMLPQC